MTVRERLFPILIISMAAAVFAAAVPALGADVVERPVRIISPRVSALGGPHPALTDSFGTYFNNPAGFYGAGPEFSFFELTMGLRGPVFTIADTFLGGGGEDDAGFLVQAAEILDGLNAGLDLLTPLSFGHVGHGLGLGVHSSSSLNLKGVSLGLEGSFTEDIVLSGGYAFRFFPDSNHTLDAGLLLKGIFRGLLEIDFPATDLDKVGLDYLMDKPFYMVSGIGIDMGLRYTYKENLAVGLAVHDLYSPTLRYAYGSLQKFLDGDPAGTTESGKIPLRINGGVQYTVDYLPAGFFISEIKLLFSYFNMLDFWITPDRSRNTILNLGAGVEVTMLEIMDLRFGFRDGLFAAGLGLDLHYFTLNGAMFGTELTTEPGLNPVYNLQLGIEVRI